MKNLNIKKKLILFLFFASPAIGQTYITWNTSPYGPTPVTGSAIGTGITVTTALTGTGNGFFFSAPNPVTNNIPFGTGNSFRTNGPAGNFPSQNLTFTFSAPVIITKYNMADIDVGDWNDSFNFIGINFGTIINFANVIATSNSAVAFTNTPSVLGNEEFVHWECSGVVTTFDLDYVGNGTLTHAFLAYSIEIIPAPTVGILCVDDDSPSFPTVGNGITGTWSPNVITTDEVGEITYTFTPDDNQALECPVPMVVTVVDCCPPNLTLSSPLDDMDNTDPDPITLLNAQDWINASNIIGVGNNNASDGVVYHAGDYVELTTGFETLTGSQFAAYPEECNAGYVYRQANPKPKTIIPKLSGDNPQILRLYSNANMLRVQMVNMTFSGIEIYSIDGKRIADRLLKQQKTCRPILPISHKVFIY